MTDIERGSATGDEDRLPWLEAVDDEDDAGSPGAGRLVAAVIVALAVIGLVVGGLFWLRDRRAAPAGSEGDLIAAPQGAYKTRPAQTGGMKVEGQGDTVYAASEGTETNAAIDLNALPEAPVTGDAKVTTADAAAAAPKAAVAAGKVATGPAPAPAKVAASTGAPVAPAKPGGPAAAAEAPMTGGMIQLGAFSSEAKANAAWKAMAARFGFLKPLTSAVTPVKSGASTLYRLRATAGGQAASVCAKLKVAGETCAVVG